MTLLIKAWLKLSTPIECRLHRSHHSRAYYLIHDFNNSLWRKLWKVQS